MVKKTEPNNAALARKIINRIAPPTAIRPKKEAIRYFQNIGSILKIRSFHSSKAKNVPFLQF
jgi:hypothetical protein